MIEFRLKRLRENADVTFGELRIPSLHFGCRTLELKNGDDLACKHSCRIPEGEYQLQVKINKLGYFAPVFKYRIPGYPVRPEFDFENNHYNNLPTGNIAIGTAYPHAFGIESSEEVKRALSEACREIWSTHPNETFVLHVYKVVRYEVVDESYQRDMVNKTWNFLDDEDENEPE